jgi:hypothetical protein
MLMNSSTTVYRTPAPRTPHPLAAIEKPKIEINWRRVWRICVVITAPIWILPWLLYQAVKTIFGGLFWLMREYYKDIRKWINEED